MKEVVKIKKVMLFILIVFVLAGCGSAPTHHKKLETTLNHSIEESKNRTVELITLTNFDWEEAFIFTPYTTEEEMKKKFGFNYKDKSNLYMRDDLFLLVFMNEGKAIQYVELDRHNTIEIEHAERITPEASVLKFD